MVIAVWEVFSRLKDLSEGKIFLCNLAQGIHLGLINASKVRDLFSDVPDVTGTNIWYFVKGKLGDEKKLKNLGLLLQNDRSENLEEFAGFGRQLIIVFKKKDLIYYINRHDELMKGHESSDFFSGKVGATTKCCSRITDDGADVKTISPVTWVASKIHFIPDESYPDAEKARDMLGLVHYRQNDELIALCFSPPKGQKCYRPTVIESQGNTRFRQHNYLNPKENRWGHTVNLKAFADNADDITGVPELTLPPVTLNDCKPVLFTNIGHPQANRDSEEEHDRFHKKLLSEIDDMGSIDGVVKYLEEKIK